jgi:regulatory protein
MSGHITALKVQQKNPQRVNVYLDGEFAFGLARITAAWLHVGQELSGEKILSLQAEDAREVAHQRALRLLERRPRSEAEIRRNLQSHKVPEDVIEDALARLRRTELVNDEKFAELWVENRTEFRPRSRKALAYEMRQRGVTSTAIEQALSQISPEDEDELAYQAASKQARKLRALEWQEFRQKMTGFLARRGFNYETSATATRRAWEALHSSDSENLTNERQ